MTMLAMRIHEYGDPSVFSADRIAIPEPGPGMVLVKVRGCALNHLDIWHRRGQPPLPGPGPHILGSDAAGEIAAFGPGADDGTMAIGDKVMIHPGISCGRCRECLSGRDNRCPRYTILGAGVPGGCAEYTVVPAANIIPMPGNLSFAEAAAVPLVFTTAWHMLDRARLALGETVLVIGGSGGVGTAAVQAARLRGARVLATAGGPEKAARVKALGAHHVIDHTAEEIDAAVKNLTGGRGADIIVENVGEAVWDAALRSMARGARLVTCGATTGPRVGIDIRHLFFKEQSLLGSFMGSKADLLTLLPFIASGELKPVVDQTLPLGEAAAAHRLIENRQHVGKIVLVP